MLPHPTRTLALLLAAAALPAQADRREIGLRLRAFERHLAAATDAGRRDAACRELDRAVQAFFRLDVAAVARALAAADAALDGAPPSPAAALAVSLQLRFDARLLPVGGTVGFALALVWREDTPLPAGLRLELAVADRPPLRFAIDELPYRGELPLLDTAAGDQPLRWRLCDGEDVLLAREDQLSLVEDRDQRLAHLQRIAKAIAKEPTALRLEQGTLVSLHKQLAAMTRARGEETLLPGARLLDEAEQLIEAIAFGSRYYEASRPGEFHLRVPTATDTFTVRLLVPPPTDAPPPLVLALHGAGGSENLFFDGYGDGEIVRQCRQRGFYLGAVRLGFGVPDLPALIDALGERYRFDRRRVLLVGHSMGAAMAVAAADAHPERYAAVAALGGGGRPTGGAALRRVPFFVATGSRDFLRAAADQLRGKLVSLQVPCEWREYPGVEHLSVVQFALPDVFAAFDRTLAR